VPSLRMPVACLARAQFRNRTPSAFEVSHTQSWACQSQSRKFVRFVSISHGLCWYTRRQWKRLVPRSGPIIHPRRVKRTKFNICFRNSTKCHWLQHLKQLVSRLLFWRLLPRWWSLFDRCQTEFMFLGAVVWVCICRNPEPSSLRQSRNGPTLRINGVVSRGYVATDMILRINRIAFFKKTKQD
jgi:hypothetical protein